MKHSVYTLKHLVGTLILVGTTVGLTACGSIQVSGYTMDPLYYRDCGPNGKFSPRDKECRHHKEPMAHAYAVQEMDTTSTWRNRPDILEWCRRIKEPKREMRCQGLPGI